MEKKKTLYLILSTFFLTGLILRLIYFREVTFTWDQARDVIQAINIWKGDPIKIIGPSTAELPGLHHGSFYWYLISPFLYLTNGNVYAVRLFLIFLNLLGVFIIYRLTKTLFKNTRIALLSSFLFSISFEAVQYGRWMSNPAPALLTIPLTFYGIWRIINQKKWGVALTLISWAFSVHFQFFLVYQLILIAPVLIWFYQRKNYKFTKEEFFGFFGAFLILLPFLIAEIKFNFQGIKAFNQLFGGQEFLRSYSAILLNFIDRIVFTFYFNIFGFNLFFAGLVTISVLVMTTVYIYKKRQYHKELVFLCIWLLSSAVIFSFEKAGAYFVTIGNLFPAIILTSFFITEFGKKIKSQRIYYISLIVLIFLGQLVLIISQNKNGESLFAVQKKMILSDQLKVIDYIYSKSENKLFVINTVTNPLFINTTWAYLFNWYGRPKYGYIPAWAGYPQDGQLGSDIKFSNLENHRNLDFYLIIEPQPGIPEYMILGISKFEDTRSRLIEKKSIGGFTVERRKLINNNGFDTDTVYKLIKKYF